MGCEEQKEQYDSFKQGLLEQQKEGEQKKPTPSELRRLHDLQKDFLKCMAAEGAIIPTFPLDAIWTYGGKPGPVITVNGNYIAVDMSAYGRPPAEGIIADPETVLVFFPDEDFGTDHEGKLQVPGEIIWNNRSAWTKA